MTLQRMQDQYLRRQKFNRKSRRVYFFPVSTLRQYSNMRQDDAAKVLGVAPITLKRICKEHNYRWPYRAYKAAQRRRERQHAAAIAAAIAAGVNLESLGAEAPATTEPVPTLTPTSLSSPSRQHIEPAASHDRVALLASRFPLDSVSSPVDLTKWLPRATSPTKQRDSPPSTALSTPSHLPMSPRKHKMTSSPLSELSLRCSSMSLTPTRLPPLHVALHPSYLAMRQHEQHTNPELRLLLSFGCRGGGTNRPSVT